MDPSLAQAAEALGLDLDPQALQRLDGFVELIARWNRVYNLTALRDPQQMRVQHLADSLSIVAPLKRWAAGATRSEDAAHRRLRILDVGSGAGLPGVVIAIAWPQAEVTCIDSVGKKASFVRQAAADLGLPNLHAVHARVEAWRSEPFDLVVSRAFASLADFTAWTRHLLAPGGVWVAMKGRLADDEAAGLPADVALFHVEPLQVPGLDAQRCLVWMRPAAA